VTGLESNPFFSADLNSLHDLVEAIPVPCTINTRADGRILALNGRMRTLMGIGEAMAVDQMTTARFYADPERRAAFVSTLEVFGAVQDLEFDAVRLDGTPVPCLASVRVTIWQGTEIIVACMIDITDRKAAEQALRTSEEKFREIAENTSDIIWHLDASMTVTYAGGGHRVLEWLDRWPLVGSNALEAFAPESAAMLHAQFEARQTQERAGLRTDFGRHEAQLLNRRGERLWIEMMAYPHRNDAGDLIGLFGVMRDISERKRAETALRRSENLFRQMFDASPVAALLIEPKTGIIFQANASAARFYGTDRHALTGLSLTDLTPKGASPSGALLEQLRTHATQNGSVVEQTHRLADGQTRRVAAHVGEVDVTVGDADTHRFLNVSLFDITDRERYANELEHRNADLRDFTAAVSHDLQEPLRMISSYLGLLKRRMSDRLSSEEQDFIHFAVDGAARMRSMLQGLLAYARVDIAPHPLQPVRLSKTVETVLETLGPLMRDCQGSVHVPKTLPVVLADPDQMLSLFQNLIGNAVRYRSPDRPCDINILWHKADRIAEIGVRDNGIGIDPKQHERIFGVFQRLHEMKDEMGTGMGLAICRRIIQRHGGHIRAESHPGQGTTFWFTLPLAPP